MRNAVATPLPADRSHDAGSGTHPQDVRSRLTPPRARRCRAPGAHRQQLRHGPWRAGAGWTPEPGAGHALSPLPASAALRDAARTLLPLVSIDAVLEVAAEAARAILGARAAAASHWAGAGHGTRTRVDAGAAGNSAATLLPPPDEAGPWRDVIDSGRPLRLSVAELQRRQWPAGPDGPGAKPRSGWLAAPLFGSDGEVAGIIQAVDRLDGKPFGATDEANLDLLAGTTSVALRSCLLFRASIDARAKLGWAAHVERIRAAELQAVIEAMGEPVLVFDAHGQVNLTNPAADRLLQGRSVTSLDDLLGRFGVSLGEAAAGPVELHLPGPPEVWLELRAYPVPGPSSRAEGVPVPGQIAVIRDVTPAHLERLHREAFLGILSHELRTPITTIYAGSKLLLRNHDGSSETGRILAGDINSEAERLFRLVEDLLVMTRSERGILELASEPVLLQRVAAAAIRLEQPRWPDTRFVLSGPADLPAVAGDALYVEQVVRNLLSNAARYGGRSNEVEIVLVENAEGLAMHVLDRGKGFLSSEVDDLFELFYRSPATAAQAAGAGIGLFVCRRLVTAMGGRIWGRPRDGGGAEFAFALPRYRPAD
jgi:signal transduction histidine kinase